MMTDVVGVLAEGEDTEQDQKFELMPVTSNATLYRYIRDLVRVCMDLAAIQAEDESRSKQSYSRSCVSRQRRKPHSCA
jgi:hypothetical protein